jgi:AcrR family transcriptional regulator
LYCNKNLIILTIKKNKKNAQALLKGAVKVLTNKGYDGETIIEITEALDISRGILHYYFKDKEDIVSKALSSSSSQMVQSYLAGLKGKSPEEIVNNVIDMHIKRFVIILIFIVFYLKCHALVVIVKKCMMNLLYVKIK